MSIRMDSSIESLVESSPPEARRMEEEEEEKDKPLPRDLSHLYSETTKRRVISKMKEYYRFFQIPGIGNLAGGLPNVRFFPYDTLEAQIAKPERWTPSPNQPDDEVVVERVNDGTNGPSSSSFPSTSLSSSDPMAAAHLTVPKAAGAPGTGPVDPEKRIDLASALQYGLAQGYPPLLSWVRQFSRQHLHPDVPYRGGVDVALTVGSTDGFAKALEIFVDPWAEGRDDPRARPGLLCETFVYGNVLSQAAPKGVQIVPVEADAGGMRALGPGGLEDVLANWDEGRGRRPHLMYTVTMGHNPTGIVLSLERRKQIYAVCSRFDVVIVEDDPYWYLQFPSAAAEEAASRNLPRPVSYNAAAADEGAASEDDDEEDAAAMASSPSAPCASGSSDKRRSSGYPFLDSLAPSFLAVDTDGRVVRLDTFSKTVAPGCRLGWVTAQPDLIERFVRVAESSTQQPSGFVQAMISELVMGPQPAGVAAQFRALRTARERAAFAGWKMDGWVRWLEGLRGEYERRMGRMCAILDAGSFQLKQGTPVRAQDAEWGVITKTQLFSFDWPRGGMFVWLRVHFEAHPLWGAATSRGHAVVDGPTLSTALMIFLTTRPYLVLVSPGMMFSSTEAVRREIGWAYLRLCFAAETEENIDACSHRFVAGVQRFWKIKKVQELEDLLKDGPGLLTAQDVSSMAADMGVWLGC